MVKPTIKNTYTYNATFDDAWKATVQTFAERSLPVSELEKETCITYNMVVGVN